MELIFSKDEANILLELVYLGNWLANATRLPKERIQKYDDFFNKLKYDFSVKFSEDIENETLYNELISLIEQYNLNMLPSIFAKAYADFKFEINKSDIAKDNDKALRQFVSNRVIRELCEKEIKTNGFNNTEVFLPDLQKEIEKEYEKMK